jgi:hypothetical protein
MQYMGGKHRIAKYFMPIVLSARKPGQVYVIRQRRILAVGRRDDR